MGVRLQLGSALPRYLALAGPTASGKTAAALTIAQAWPVEIKIAAFFAPAKVRAASRMQAAATPVREKTASGEEP